MITFEIVGLPAAQGSKRHVGRGVMVEMSKRLPAWRDSVTAAARDIADRLDGPLDGPLALTVEFRFPMPTSRRKAVREAGRNPKTSAPDLDKCLRALGDGLEAGGLIRSDALIHRVTASKVEVVGWTGATVTITPAVDA